MPYEPGDILLDEDTIRRRVAELAAQICEDCAGRDLVVVGTLKGAVVFLADLVRRFDMPVCLGFASARSYGDATQASGEVALDLGLCGDVAGRDVLVVEDIVDTGRTLTALVARLGELGCRSVMTCCLLDKPSRRLVAMSPDYIGFEIPDHFVVGYGLDYAERYRNLPYVAVLRRKSAEQEG